jgi:hypothetical protein
MWRRSPDGQCDQHPRQPEQEHGDLARDLQSSRSLRASVVRVRERTQLCPEIAEDAREQSGHLHLGDPEIVCDLTLGEPVEEAQLEDVAVTLAETTYDGGQRDPRLGGRLVVFLTADQLTEGGAAFLADRSIQRRRGEATLPVERLAHIGGLLAEVLGQLGGQRRPPQGGREVVLGLRIRRGGRTIQPRSRK